MIKKQHSKHTVPPLLWFLATTLVFFALSTAPSQASPVRIGVMAPLTGKLAAEGEDARRVLNLLAVQWNASGALGNSPLELEFQDDAGDPRTAALAAQKLVARGVVAIISAYGSSVTEAAQHLINEANLPHFSSGATSVRLTEKKLPRFFRMGPRDDAQSRKAVDYITSLGVTTIAIVHDNTSHPRGFAEEVQQILTTSSAPNTPRIVFFDALPPGQRDYSTVLQKIRQTAPEMLLYTGYYPETALLLRQKAEMNWHVPMLGGDASNHQDLVSMTGVSTVQDYMFLSAPMPQYLTSPQALIFMQAYIAQHGQAPLSVWSALAGDGLNIIAQALSQGGSAHFASSAAKGTDTGANSVTGTATAPKTLAAPNAKPHAMADAIAAYAHSLAGQPYAGLTGPVSFDAKGDRTADLYMLYRVDRGIFVPKSVVPQSSGIQASPPKPLDN